MITYSIEPISPAEASKLKAWLGSAEAQLFKDCVSAEMHSKFFNAINIKCKPAKSIEDSTKNAARSAGDERAGLELQSFLSMFERLGEPDHGFHRIKINT